MKTKLNNYDFIENYRARRSGPRTALPCAGLACSVEEEQRPQSKQARSNTATRAKAIRHAETGRRRPYSSSGEF